MGASNSRSSIPIANSLSTEGSLNLEPEQSYHLLAQLLNANQDTPSKEENGAVDSISTLYWLNHGNRRADLEQGGSNIASHKTQQDINKGPSIIQQFNILEALQTLVLSGALVSDDNLTSSSQSTLSSHRLIGNKVSKWLLADAVHFATLRPSPSIHYNAAITAVLHSKLMEIRSHHKFKSENDWEKVDDIMLIACAISTAQTTHSHNARNKNTDESSNSQSLSMSVSIGIKLFFKLLRSLQRAGHVHGLLKLASSLPPLLLPMGPRALASEQKPIQLLYSETSKEIQAQISPLEVLMSSSSASSILHEEDKFVKNIASTTKGNVGKNNSDDSEEEEEVSTEHVVDAVWNAVEELSSLDPAMLGVENHSSTLSALVALAVKRGELHPLLKASGILLYGSNFSKQTLLPSSHPQTIGGAKLDHDDSTIKMGSKEHAISQSKESNHPSKKYTSR